MTEKPAPSGDLRDQIDRDEWRNRAHRWQATAGPPEDSDEYDLDTDPDALRRDLDEVIRNLDGRGPKMIHDAVWARVRPVLRIFREKLAEQRQRADKAERRVEHFEEHAAQVDADLGIETHRAETAERELAEALDAVAAERRDKLAAEAAVRRARALADKADADVTDLFARQFDGAPFPAMVPTEVLRSALDAEQPEETP